MSRRVHPTDVLREQVLSPKDSTMGWILGVIAALLIRCVPACAIGAEPVVEVQMLCPDVTFPFVLVGKHLIAPRKVEDAGERTLVEGVDVLLERCLICEPVAAVWADFGVNSRRRDQPAGRGSAG